MCTSKTQKQVTLPWNPTFTKVQWQKVLKHFSDFEIIEAVKNRHLKFYNQDRRSWFLVNNIGMTYVLSMYVLVSVVLCIWELTCNVMPIKWKYGVFKVLTFFKSLYLGVIRFQMGGLFEKKKGGKSTKRPVSTFGCFFWFLSFFTLVSPWKLWKKVVLAQIWTSHSNGLKKKRICWEFQ